MNVLLSIYWNPSPYIFETESIKVRWYSLMFAIAFAVGTFITKKVFQKNNIPEGEADNLLFFIIPFTILGARFAHVFFYQWDYYSQNLGEILQIWEGGLASHGAGLGMVIATFLFCKYRVKKPVIHILDQITLPTIFGGALIRIGNFMNGEIVGKPTNSFIGFVFPAYGTEPRYPAQLIESIAYFIIAGLLAYLIFKKDAIKRQGYMLGVFLISVFTFRFLIEFIKDGQSNFDYQNLLNTGQILSIPFIFAGLYFMFKAKKSEN